MFNRAVARARRILRTFLVSMLCSGCSLGAVAPQVVIQKPRVDPALLEECPEPERPSRDKSIAQNSAAIVDMEIKFEECAASKKALIDVVK